MQPRIEDLLRHLLRSETDGEMRLISVGAGPGPDALALHLLLEYLTLTGTERHRLSGVLLDREKGWRHIVTALSGE